MVTRRRVLVVPGFAASDQSTQVIRAALASRGHRTHGWRLGRNTGPDEATTSGLLARVESLHEREGAPIALVGWSLGGVYAHWLTRRHPDLIHCVITLGSPLQRSGQRPRPLQVPVTSVYSRNDRVVPWSASLVDDTARRHENVEVRAGHLAMGFDPAVLFLIENRVRQDPANWQPFVPPVSLRLGFPTGNGTVRGEGRRRPPPGTAPPL